jgi:DNA-binding response OmpR family regulator
MKRREYVAVVETDELIRELLERWLTEAGYEVLAAAQGAPARRERPSLIIANVPNPRSAQELIASLKAAYAAPVLALSARFQRGLASSRNAARSLGVRRVLPKPFTRKELLVAVQECIKEPE